MSLEFGLTLSAIGIAWVFIGLGIIAFIILALRKLFEEKAHEPAALPLSDEEAAAMTAVISTLVPEKAMAREAYEVTFEHAEGRPWLVAGRVESTLRRPAGRWK